MGKATGQKDPSKITWQKRRKGKTLEKDKSRTQSGTMQSSPMGQIPPKGPEGDSGTRPESVLLASCGNKLTVPNVYTVIQWVRIIY